MTNKDKDIIGSEIIILPNKTNKWRQEKRSKIVDDDGIAFYITNPCQKGECYRITIDVFYHLLESKQIMFC